MNLFIKVISYVLDYINSIPQHSWYVLGSLIASSGLVIGVVAWIRRHHLKKYAEDLKVHFIALNVVFWSTLTTVLSFILTNGATFGQFLPFLGQHMPQVIAIATILYQISKPSLSWWKARKDGKAISNVNLPNLTPQVEAVTSTSTVSGQPSSSFGTASAGVDVIAPSAPPENLFL